MGEKAGVLRSNVLEEVFYAGLRIIYKFGIDLSQSNRILSILIET